MDEHGVFEINDFTIVTDMEQFADAFEGVLQKFDCVGNRPLKSHASKLSTSDTTIVPIGKNELKIEFIQRTAHGESSGSSVQDKSADQSLMDNTFRAGRQISKTNNDSWNNDEISLKFGVDEYIVVSPNNESHHLVDENNTKTLMGIIRTVLNINGCEMPVFCYVKNQSLGMIEGYASDGNETITFSTVVLRNINRRHCNMNELLYIFKEQLGLRTSAFHDEVRISTKFTYLLKLKQERFRFMHTSDTVKNLTVGPTFGIPFESVQIAALWHFFRENSLTENHEHSDFDIDYANLWNVKLTPPTQQLTGALDEVLGIYLDNRRKEMRSDLPCETILGKAFFQKKVPAVFKKLTVNSTSDFEIGKTVQKTDISGPVSRELINAWLDFIFADNLNTATLAFEMNSWNLDEANCDKEENTSNSEDFINIFNPPSSDRISYLAPYKCAKQNTVTWKLAVALANIRGFLKSEPRAEPYLWVEFVLRLRQKYDKMEKIENVKNGIDNTQCLFSQKIQMLQLCINARLKRHTSFDIVHGNNTDEFFDANDTFESTDFSALDRMARLKEANLRLIGNPEKKMYIPVTQEMCPLTDDMIDAKNEHLLDLMEGDRQEIQMELIRSDMQSFKAANPDAVFADFLRWHSPKDYDEKTKSISERMLIPNNIWITTWETAKAVPAAIQTRIFNDTKIAEEIFEMFENASLDMVRDWMKPTTFASALERLRDVENFMENENEKLRIMARKLSNATLNNFKNDYCEVAKFCSQAEIIHSMKLYMVHLFEKTKKVMHPPYPSQSAINDFAKQLIRITMNEHFESDGMRDKRFTIKPQEPIGRALSKICRVEDLPNDSLERPSRKEYIFCWNVKRPSTTTLAMAHRMYADLNTDSHRLYISATEDAMFFNTSYF